MIKTWGWPLSAIILASLFLNSGAGVTPLNDPHDGLRYIGMTESILHGQWLGSYDQMTLIRSPVYPLGLAANAYLGLPLHTVQQILYLSSLFLLAAALLDLGLNRWRCVLLLILGAYHPVGLIPPSYVTTEALYTPATTAVVAGCLGMIAAITASPMHYAVWCIILALVFPVFWYTRPEAIWILPMLMVAFGYLIIRMRKTRTLSIKRVAVGVLMPVVTVWLAGSLMAEANSAHYGVRVVHELAEPGFTEALRQLTRVEPDARKPFVPVTFRAMAAAARISPHFAQLMPYLSGQTNGQGWARFGCEWMGICDELVAGWSMWAIRDAAAAAGVFTSGKKAATFFKSMAGEIKEACLNGSIPCTSNSTGNLLAPPVRLSDAPHIATSVFRMLRLALTFGDLDEGLQAAAPQANPPLSARYAAMTHDRTTRGYLALKLHYFSVIVYKWFQIGLGLAIFPLLVLLYIRGQAEPEVWIVVFLFAVLIVSRVLLIAYLDALSFKAQLRYLLVVYPALMGLAAAALPLPRKLLQKQQSL